MQAVVARAWGGGRLSLRTLIVIRWFAVAGQLAAVLLVHEGLGLPLPIGSALLVIAASALLNLAATLQSRARARLVEADAMLYLAYDLLQLSVLLFLTGGLDNPFALLLLAPLIVSVILLSRTAVIALTLLTLLAVAVLALWHYPLPGSGALPPLYALGMWVALSLAAVFIPAYLWRVADDARRVGDALAASRAALARQQQLSALGALAAAAAHELGSPLGTIALVAREMQTELPPDSPLAEDVALLISQTNRCREILTDLVQRPEAPGGEPFDQLSLPTLVEAAAQPHRRPEVELVIETAPGDTSPMPVVRRTPELMHGLGNLLQNALQFARRRVMVRVTWTRDEARVTLTDDGPGFPPHLLARLGEPYVSGRAGPHMGLGIFIAATLLERSRGMLAFANARTGGAQVVVRWRRPIFEAEEITG